jgi:hypothetical protein
MRDRQKQLLVRLSTLQAEIDKLKVDIKKPEKQEGKENGQST